MNKPEYSGNINALTKIGNFEGNLPSRKIVPVRCNHTLPGLVLKEYILKEKGKNPPRKEEVKYYISVFLLQELLSKRLAPLSGIGFSITSDGILNVCRWDAKYMDVIVPQIYTLEVEASGLFKRWTLQEVEKVGAFCSGEKRVYDHENEAWLKYLNSKRTNKDKVVYLNDFLIE